ncbi:hypothetical protein BDFB_015312 [Asbolus verrucosus]|uniref:Uncharacterized protein n=1 Tax=Asbolus verrucosus TaxID=1661398 RepID=A0A482V1I2_ASBVE|nr:hypothetical protein BDFB_015312 [Asbolus verrucosus]
MEQKLMAFGHIQCKIAWKSFVQNFQKLLLFIDNSRKQSVVA